MDKYTVKPIFLGTVYNLGKIIFDFIMNRSNLFIYLIYTFNISLSDNTAMHNSLIATGQEFYYQTDPDRASEIKSALRRIGLNNGKSKLIRRNQLSYFNLINYFNVCP